MIEKLLTPFSFLLTPLASRFVAGKTPESAIAAAQRANAMGLEAILDFLGEDVTSAPQAQRAVEEYLKLLELIHTRQVHAAVSLKVSQMGMLISREHCLENLSRIAQAAKNKNLFIWIDMEGSAHTQKTIDVFDVLRATYPKVGLCLQAYLVRTGGDFDRLTRNPFNIRLCKGAYKEPPTIALASKPAVDGNFRMLIQKALDQIVRGCYPAFATHDASLIEQIKSFVKEKSISKDKFEFQMLYGVQNHRLQALAKEGFKASVYIPYGTHWLPYFIRRLRERKENVYFLMRNLFPSPFPSPRGEGLS